MKILKILNKISFNDFGSIEEILTELDDYIFKLEKIKAELESYLMMSETEKEEDLKDAWEYLLSLIDTIDV